MARGFNISVRVEDSEGLTEDALAAEIEASGALTELESETYLPAAVDAARDLCASMADGPFLVEVKGSDRTQESGEESVISVTVTSRYTANQVSAGEVEPETPSAFAPRPEGSDALVENDNGEADGASA